MDTFKFIQSHHSIAENNWAHSRIFKMHSYFSDRNETLPPIIWCTFLWETLDPSLVFLKNLLALLTQLNGIGYLSSPTTVRSMRSSMNARNMMMMAVFLDCRMRAHPEQHPLQDPSDSWTSTSSYLFFSRGCDSSSLFDSILLSFTLFLILKTFMDEGLLSPAKVVAGKVINHHRRVLFLLSTEGCVSQHAMRQGQWVCERGGEGGGEGGTGGELLV